MTKIEYETTSEFDKDFKKLSKKYRTLTDDLELLKKAVIELHHIQGIDNNAVFEIPGYCSKPIISCKIKKFACKAMKGKGSKTGLRLIYIFIPAENRVIFIEIYYKGDQANMDEKRLKVYYDELTAQIV